MKLDEYEQDYVKYFIQVKGYHQYEVLAEILDHFVLVLEEKKDENPAIAFEDLVDEVFEREGKVMFAAVNKATKERAARKFKSILARNAIAILHYKYVLLMALMGFLLYHLQSFLHNENGYSSSKFAGIFQYSKYVFIFLGGEFTSAIKLGNRKFMCNKIAKRYGYVLFIAIMVSDVISRVIITPSSFGFNMYYLISAVNMVVQIVLLYVLIRTAKDIVEESDEMEETYQILK